MSNYLITHDVDACVACGICAAFCPTDVFTLFDDARAGSTGVAAMMFFHIFENIGMVIGLMPVTGIPLPFVSYGGSNYLANILSIGIVLNVTMRSRARTRKQKSRVIEPARL